MDKQFSGSCAPARLNTKPLRNFSAIHIDEDQSTLTGDHENALFFNCTFDKLTGLTLKNCVLDRSKFVTTDPKNMLGFTLTLNCHSFENVELSPEVFDTLLLLICKSAGNLEKRLKIINEVVGRDRSYELLKRLREIE